MRVCKAQLFIKQELNLEKLAIIELNTTNVKLIFANVIKNKSFLIYNEVVMPVNLTKDFESDEIIKSTVIKDVVTHLTVFKKMIDAEEITEVIALACDFVRSAKNRNGFLNEIYSVTNFDFRVISPEEEINYVYSAAINTFNKPKALIVNITEFDTQFLLYNRRNILNTEIVPFGYGNVAKQVQTEGLEPQQVADNISEFFAQQIKAFGFASELEEEFEVIGFGVPFLNLGNLSRRAKKYALDVEHNYPVCKEDFVKVYEVVKPLDQARSAKIKGVSTENTQYLTAGLSIINAVFNKINKNEVAISKTSKIEGLLLNTIIPLTLEKPISDNLGYSLQVINEYYDRKPNNSEHVYNLSMILFKQLKVLHKLNRSFVRVLRVASYLCASGKRVDYYNNEKASFNVILNSNIYGINHSELVLSAFVALLRQPDNFNLSDWVKYRDLVTETDLDAVKKLAVILKVAESLDVTAFGNVTDISCDILGDSVIMKTITRGEAGLEIKQAMLYSSEFKKAFNKNLEIL